MCNLEGMFVLVHNVATVIKLVTDKAVIDEFALIIGLIGSW